MTEASLGSELPIEEYMGPRFPLEKVYALVLERPLYNEIVCQGLTFREAEDLAASLKVERRKRGCGKAPYSIFEMKDGFRRVG